MSHYRNFRLATYYIASGTASATREKLQQDLDFFSRHLRLDRVYLEPFRDGLFASEEQVRLVKGVLEENGIQVHGGITTNMKDPTGQAPKQRLFNVFCYTDPIMLKTLAEVSAFNGRMFDAWIIDDFYFTNCTCQTCRDSRDAFNKKHGIADGSWEAWRTDRMLEVSREYMIAPSREANPDSRITIKFPNWMESFQETGYDPLRQKDLFDCIYTGTETRDPVHTDQHLPRYLSFSLMRYFEALAPGRNGGGWFDPYDCRLLEYYLEQAYLTAFSKPRELMMFCFQSLADTVNVAALGFMLDKLDALLDHLGDVLGVPCYIPNGAQGEDNVQDFLGMHGFPIVTTPYFPAQAPVLLLTASSACDRDIVDRLEQYLAAGGKAVVTSGFVQQTLDCGLKRITSLRDRGRKVAVRDYLTERLHMDRGWEYPHGRDEVLIPVLEFRNNATWGAVCKGIRDEESYTLLARDTYGLGQMMTLVIPESFSDLKRLPQEVLSRMRREFTVNGVYLEGAPMVSLFLYDNDSLVLYPYADNGTQDTDVFLHVHNARALVRLDNAEEFLPFRLEGDEAVFRLSTQVAKFVGYHILRGEEAGGSTSDAVQ